MDIDGIRNAAREIVMDEPLQAIKAFHKLHEVLSKIDSHYPKLGFVKNRAKQVRAGLPEPKYEYSFGDSSIATLTIRGALLSRSTNTLDPYVTLRWKEGILWGLPHTHSFRIYKVEEMATASQAVKDEAGRCLLRLADAIVTIAEKKGVKYVPPEVPAADAALGGGGEPAAAVQ
jgi:hypothetical protein